METASVVVTIIIILFVLYCLPESKQSENVYVKTSIEEGQGELEPPSNVDWKSREDKNHFKCISSVHQKIDSEKCSDANEQNVVMVGRIVKIETEETKSEPKSSENGDGLLKAGFKNKEEKQPPTALQHKIENEEIDGPNAEEDNKMSSETKVKIERENDESDSERREIICHAMNTDSKVQGEAQEVKRVSTLLLNNIGSAEKAKMVAPNKVERSKIVPRSGRVVQITSSIFVKKGNDEMVPPTLMKTASGVKMKLAGLLMPKRSPPSLNINWRDNQEKQGAKYISSLHHRIRSTGKYEIVAPNEVQRSKVASSLARVVQLTSVSQRIAGAVGTERSLWSPEDGPTAGASDTETMNNRGEWMLIQKMDAYKFFEKLEKDSMPMADKKKLDGKKHGQ